MVDQSPTPTAQRAVDALLREREASYLEEYGRLIEAVYAVAARTGTVEPRVADIVAESGLSNQVFYRHFASKDELLQAVLEDGRHRLVGYLSHRTNGIADPVEAISVWIRGVLAQAADRTSAARSRPFAVHASRLGALFPEAQGDSVAGLREPLRALVDAGVESGRFPKAAVARVDFVFWSVFDALQRHLVGETAPSPDEVDALEAFCLAGLGLGSR